MADIDANKSFVSTISQWIIEEMLDKFHFVLLSWDELYTDA